MSLPDYKRPANDFDYEVYLRYLESKTWAKLRNRRLKIDDYKCAICESPYNLQVHHLLYPKILGTEHVSHLVTLCTQCHKEIENRKNHSLRNTKAQSWYSNSMIWVRFSDRDDFESRKDDLLQYCNTDKRNHRVVVYLENENVRRLLCESDGACYMKLVDYRWLSEQKVFDIYISF
jgi:hypothetical protein